ncbi:hypothetical protein SAMN04487970_103760 [Paenibacillus tianmuensis]|uniref:DUF2262 domain-containing protein n=1 Tax=Paenibacillus tianmuensis TaxID=624147 RepID=A0A1G4T0G0_9BACL|nr:DUF2262 domain-containing protein [Paenibacillus tianmuensis]SCW74009.1 hypothetical protein SAMN04487970_103760 [Paenibacillus tianmuensis]
MNYYDTSDMLNKLKIAYQGDGEAIAAIQALTLPCAVTPDYTVLIAVQEKHATQDEDGLVRVLNKAPEAGGGRKQVADIYQCGEESSSWCSVPIPFRFVVREVCCEDGVFRFISETGEAVAGTPVQINRAMLDVSYTFNGVPESDIEQCFRNISATVVPPRPPKKTAADNPPIQDDGLGTLTFYELLQQFETTVWANDHSFDLVIHIDSREEALALLPAVRGIIARLEAIDSKARAFAADELLELKNDNWLVEDEEPVTKKDFVQRMSIETIAFDEDGAFEIWFADGDLFWGHSIMVSMNSEGEPEDAGMHG